MYKGRDFNKVLTEILKSVRMGKAHLAPAFCFVDPFGWQDLNYDTLSDFMMEPHSELFITFMSGFINRFLESERHHESLESIFGNEQLTDLQKIENTEERTERMLYFFKENLKSRCKSKGGQKEFYDIGFKTRDRSNNKLYHLLYLTRGSNMTELEIALGEKVDIGNFDPLAEKLFHNTLKSFGLKGRWWKERH